MDFSHSIGPWFPDSLEYRNSDFLHLLYVFNFRPTENSTKPGAPQNADLAAQNSEVPSKNFENDANTVAQNCRRVQVPLSTCSSSGSM